ncbi:MAG: PTS sugar transporter subunit IIC [Deferribacterales bacterium]
MNLFLAAVYAGLISVDRFAAFNLMLSRPIVVAFVLGLIFGNQQECFYIGLVFEAVGLIDVPFGTRIPKEDSFGAFAACMLFAMLPIEHSDEFVLGFLISILLMFPVTYTCMLGRSFNKKLFMRQYERGRVNALQLLLLGMAAAFVRGVVVYGLGTVLVYAIYNAIHGYLETRFNLFLFSLMIFTFLSGYVVRFLSVKSFVKYVIFACGLAAGWMIL